MGLDRPWARFFAGLVILLTGVVLGFQLNSFLKKPPLNMPAPLEKLAEDLMDLTDDPGEKGENGPEPFSDGTEKDRRGIESSDLPKLYPNLVFRQGNPEIKQVALTFDDGPDDTFTPQILDILRDMDVRATFFITGVRGEEFPGGLKRISREGHSLASHGYYHKDFTTLSRREIEADLQKNKALVAKVTGKTINLFRPPYGALNTKAVETIKDAGYKIILWNVDSLDWMNLPRDAVLENIIPYVGNGAIVLQHCAGGPGQDLTGTIEALPKLISHLRGKNFTFVTVHELLGISPLPRR